MPVKNVVYLCIVHYFISTIINYTLNSLSLSDYLKAYSEFLKSAPVMSSSCNYKIIMSRTLKVTGNHAMHDCGA